MEAGGCGGGVRPNSAGVGLQELTDDGCVHISGARRKAFNWGLAQVKADLDAKAADPAHGFGAFTFRAPAAKLSTGAWPR